MSARASNRAIVFPFSPISSRCSPRIFHERMLPRIDRKAPSVSMPSKHALRVEATPLKAISFALKRIDSRQIIAAARTRYTVFLTKDKMGLALILSDDDGLALQTGQFPIGFL